MKITIWLSDVIHNWTFASAFFAGSVVVTKWQLDLSTMLMMAVALFVIGTLFDVFVKPKLPVSE